MNKIIPLSPIDHIFTGIGSYPIEFIFSYKRTLNAAKLKLSLKETIRHFPAIDSQLIVLDNGSFGFDLSSEGVVFEELHSDINFEDNPERSGYIDPVNSAVGEALTRIRLTQTPGGSVLGVSISHSIVDGFSYFYFLSSWARMFHGKPFYPPVHTRDMLIPSNLETGNPITKESVREDSGLFWEAKRSPIPRDMLVWETVKYSNTSLKALTEELQKLSPSRLSFNDIVTTQLAQKYINKWNTEGVNGPGFISCPVDFRRIYSDFPQTYFGNAVALATTPIDIQELNQITPIELSGLIRKSISMVNDDYIDKSMQCLMALRNQEGLSVNEEIHVMHPHSGLLVTNLSRLPVNEIEFDGGPPVSYEILTAATRGAVVLPDENGLQVRVCCPVK